MLERFYPPIDRAASRAEGPLEKRGGSGKVRLPLPPEGWFPNARSRVGEPLEGIRPLLLRAGVRTSNEGRERHGTVLGYEIERTEAGRLKL